MISLESHKRSPLARGTAATLEDAKHAYGHMMRPWVQANINDWCMANPTHRLVPFFRFLEVWLDDVLTGSLDHFLSVLNPTLRILFRFQNFSPNEKKLILKVLGYKKFRDNSLSQRWAASLGVRTCIYCNASYALKLGKSHRYKLKFNIDHFLPEEKYPHLCLSFFNLVPCCGNCNIVKSSRTPTHHLKYYPFDRGLDDFAVFRVDYNSVTNFLLSGDENVLDIILELRAGIDAVSYLPALAEYDAFFDVHGLYALFKIEVASFLTKLIHYDQTRMTSLRNLQLGVNDIDSRLDRYLQGEFKVKEEVLMRPLSKLYRDIQADPAIRRIVQALRTRTP